MAGLHLKQLHTVCTGIKTGANAALAANSLAALTAVATEPRATTRTFKRPLLTVTLAPTRERDHQATMSRATVLESVRVEFLLELDGTEAEALAYEGTLSRYLAGLKATIAAGVTDATLNDWVLLDGEAGPDEETSNRNAWRVLLTCRADLEW